ncbi:MAG: acyltransferase, partial [Acidobacteria bacterium]|nr:acyltransferase [Acidobacteriota bacterium]
MKPPVPKAAAIQAGPLQEFLAQLARRLGIWLVGGTVPIRVPAADKVRAACLVLD